jgi:hypothetical protein
MTIPPQELRRLKAVEAISRALAVAIEQRGEPSTSSTSVEICALLDDLDAAHRGRVPETWCEHLKQLEQRPRLGPITPLERRKRRMPALIVSHLGFSTSRI